MKKKFILMILLLSIFVPINIWAEQKETDYVDIYDTLSIHVGDLDITNVSFKDYSKSSSQSFGVTGNITNNKEQKEYVSQVNFYDANYNLLCSSKINQIAPHGSSIFNHFANLELIHSYDVSYIKYIKLIIDDSVVAVNNNKTPSKVVDYSHLDYVIDKYNIVIFVNENNTFDITETITAHYNVLKHGILRSIPLHNEIERLDKTTSQNRAQISNLSVDSKYSTYKENGNMVIKIGDKKETFTGDATYIIKYNYNIGKDPMKEYDELYFNLIGTEWDTVIGNVSFKITMPKDFDSSKLGFSKGIKGSTRSDGIRYSVDGRVITGSYDGILGSGEALTVRCELPEGYFIGAGLVYTWLDYLPWIVPIIFIIIAYWAFMKYGKNDLVIDTVEFYPPEGYNSLDTGFLYKGSAVNQDVTSLLIYLANKGYLKITEIESKTLFSKKNGFKLTKLKDYDGNNDNERLFFNGLFKTGDEVTQMDLYDRFYLTMNRILRNTNNKNNKSRIFEKSGKKVRILLVLLIILAYVAITILPMQGYGMEMFLISLLFPLIGFTILFSSIFGNFKPRLFGIMFGAFFGGMPWFLIVFPNLRYDNVYLIGYIIGIIAIIGIIMLFNKSQRRTKYGNDILGRIRGFKNFLETAEKEKLEMMVEENPNYFYDILPYTYVLGVSDKWIKKFEAINLQAPDWYDGYQNFNIMNFGNFMNQTFTSASSAMSSSPSDSGGSSGGGSSGGGSGGGGGSSW